MLYLMLLALSASINVALVVFIWINWDLRSQPDEESSEEEKKIYLTYLE